MNRMKRVAIVLALTAGVAQAAFEPAKITPQTGPRENLERSFFYSLHETDKEKSLPRILLVGDRMALSTYASVQQALRGRAVVTAWDSSYDLDRPEFDALLDIYLRTHDYAAVYLSNGCETRLKPPAFAVELARVVRNIRAVQPKSTKLVLATVPPKYPPKDKSVVPYNDAIRQVAAEGKVDAVSDLFTPGTTLSSADFYSDGCCGKAVYDRLAEVVSADLSRFLPEKGMAVAVEPKKSVPTCTDYAFPIHPAIGGRENIEWSTFYAFHETDKDKDLPRVLMVGDSITQSFYEEAARQLRGKANVSVWVNSYSSLRPEYQAKLKIFLRTQKYAVVHYNSNLHCYPTDEDWEKGLRLSLKMIREEQPQAKIVWVNNPLPRDRKPNMKKRYHDIGCRVTAEFGVDGVNDIHKMTEPFTPDMYHDEVHFEKPAQKMAADQAVRAILPLLPKQ